MLCRPVWLEPIVLRSRQRSDLWRVRSNWFAGATLNISGNGGVFDHHATIVLGTEAR